LHNQSSGDTNTTDLKSVIPYVKRKVLENTRVVFSGVVPTHVPLEKSKAYMIAQSLGAKVLKDIRVKDKVATHLIAARGGTAKVNEARRLNEKNKSNPPIHLVTPDWLWCCAERWEKAEEAIFPLYKSAPVTLKPPAHCSSPEIAFAERCPPIESLPEAVMNPFLAFSDETLKDMGNEIDDELSSDSSSDSEPDVTNAKDPGQLLESSEDSLTGEMPKGQKRKRKTPRNNDEDSDEDGPVERFRRGENVPSDYEIASQSDDDDEVRMKNQDATPDFDDDTRDDMDEDEEDDELGAQLEREFLKDCNSSRSSFNND